MDIMEIILLIAGGIIFILSFLIPEKKEAVSATLREEEIRDLISKELESVRSHVDEVVEEAVTYAMEKTERSLERLSNEKIMAVSEYSETVLAQIHKDHEEAMFLYDMLNNKHISLKDTMVEVTRTVKEAQEAMTEIKKASPEAVPFVAEESAEVVEEQTPVLMTDAAKPQERELAELLAEDTADSIEVTADVERNNNDKILELYGQGKDAVTIARELGLGVGEVKLVIDLFRG